MPRQPSRRACSMPARIRAAPMPWPWNSGVTDTGASPRQRSGSRIGENRMWPTTWPSRSATSAIAASPSRRSASTNSASSPWPNAAATTARSAAASSARSSRMLASIILADLHVEALVADGRDAGEQRQPAGHAELELGRAVALAVGDQLDEESPAQILADRDRGAAPGHRVGPDDAQPVQPDRAAQFVDRVEP